MKDPIARPAAMGSAPLTAAPRILVHLPNWLGDVVMSTPLLQFLCQAFAECPVETRPTLHLAVRQPWSVLFAADTRLDVSVVVDRGGRHGGVAGIWRQGADMKRGRFDAVLLGPPSLRAALTATLARIPLRLGRATDGRGLLLNPGLAPSPRGSRHFSYEMLDLGLALLEALQIPSPDLSVLGTGSAGLPLSSLPGCAEIAPVVISEPGQPLWVVAPGTTYGEAKTWPLARMAEFVELAAGEYGARVVLLGDAQVADFVAVMRRTSHLVWSESLDLSSQVVDLTGRTDLTEVVQVMKAAAAFVGNDSGLMHLAGALGLPCVGIFGSSNPDWTHPLGVRTAAVVADGFACRPCYRKTCNQPRFCLETITAEAVLNQVQDLLTQPPAPPSTEAREVQ